MRGLNLPDCLDHWKSPKKFPKHPGTENAWRFQLDDDSPNLYLVREMVGWLEITISTHPSIQPRNGLEKKHRNSYHFFCSQATGLIPGLF